VQLAVLISRQRSGVLIIPKAIRKLVSTIPPHMIHLNKVIVYAQFLAGLVTIYFGVRTLVNFRQATYTALLLTEMTTLLLLIGYKMKSGRGGFGKLTLGRRDNESYLNAETTDE